MSLRSSDFSIGLLKEPLLEFGHHQLLDDPRLGLATFGPLAERHPKQIRLGIVGTPTGAAKLQEWLRFAGNYIPALSSKLHQAPFPGFEAAFGVALPSDPVITLPISPSELARAIRISDRHIAIFETVSLFEQQIRRIVTTDDADVQVWFVVIPEDIYRLGRPLSSVPISERVSFRSRMNARFARRLDREPSLFSEDMQVAEVYQHELDFHNQLKARLLDVRAVVQIVRETSLETERPSSFFGSRRLQDPATVAWNLSTTTFYKAGGRPWKLGRLRDRVCYVGMAFKRMPGGDPRSACCGAQLFLDSGDGLVFKGAIGRWYSERTGEFHLTREGAEEMMRSVLKEYDKEFGGQPRELFVHGRSRFSSEEMDGFRAAAHQTRIVGVRIQRTQDLKLYRPGNLPVIRGTYLQISKATAFMWTAGYVPAQNTYAGREVPNPLRVDVNDDDVDLHQVLDDIMGLTKLNFNSCIYADGLPVTLRFADAIGEILTASVRLEAPPLPFRHYI